MTSEYLYPLIIWIIIFSIFFILFKRFKKKKVKKILAHQFQGELDLNIKAKVEFKKYRNFILKSSFFKPIYLLVSIIIIFLLINIDYDNLFNGSESFLYVLPLSLFALFILQPIFTYFRIRKIYNQSDILKNNTEYRITNNSIHVISNTIDAKQTWENFIDFKETNDFFIFYSSGSTATFLQKNWFSPDQMKKFRHFLNSSVI